MSSDGKRAKVNTILARLAILTHPGVDMDPNKEADKIIARAREMESQKKLNAARSAADYDSRSMTTRIQMSTTIDELDKLESLMGTYTVANPGTIRHWKNLMQIKRRELNQQLGIDA